MSHDLINYSLSLIATVSWRTLRHTATALDSSAHFVILDDSTAHFGFGVDATAHIYVGVQ